MKILKVIAMLAAAAVIAFVAFKLGQNSVTPQEEKATLRPIDIKKVEAKLSQVSELATVSYAYTDIAKHEKQGKLWGLNIPFSSSSILVQYSGVIKAGINLKEAKFDVKDSLVTFYLPQAQMLSHDIDQQSLQILDQDNGFFSKIKVTDFTKFCAEHRDTIEARALASGLLEQAQEKAAESLSLITDPLIADGYIVNLKQIQPVEEPKKD